jgi:hypothetical protein
MIFSGARRSGLLLGGGQTPPGGRRGVRRIGLALVLAGALCVLVGAPTASAAKNGPPLINVEGNSYTQSTDPTGRVVTGQDNFSMAAKESRAGSVSGTFTEQLYSVARDGTLTQIGHNDVNVECLSADKTTGTVWFSGLVTAGNDQRLPTEQQQQEQNIISSGNLILLGRFRDTNGDGIADERSLFLTDATTGYPNALLLSSDNGTVTSPWFISGDGTSAASACLLHDNGYLAADYNVVDGPTNQVQWLEPDDSTPVGSPITGTAAALSSPPSQSVYSVASFTRTLLSPTLYLTIR